MKKFLIFVFSVFLIVGISGIANATPITFMDNNNYFPTWGNGTPDDNYDLIGGPQISSMTVDINGSGVLSSITISMAANPLFYGGSGLFIDSDKDLDWDYFAASGVLYDVSSLATGIYKGDNDATYVMSSWASGNFRDNHPVGIVVGNSPQIQATAFTYAYSGTTLTYTFDTLSTSSDLINISVPSGNQMAAIIGYTVQCANDVIITPVSEPATMLLLGAGLIGLAGLGRRRFFKKS